MDIDRLLKAVGKTIFVEYYEDFKMSVLIERSS